MLEKDKNKRISSKEAFDDIWIQKNSSINTIDKNCLNNLSNFKVFIYQNKKTFH